MAAESQGPKPGLAPTGVIEPDFKMPILGANPGWYKWHFIKYASDFFMCSLQLCCLKKIRNVGSRTSFRSTELVKENTTEDTFNVLLKKNERQNPWLTQISVLWTTGITILFWNGEVSKDRRFWDAPGNSVVLRPNWIQKIWHQTEVTNISSCELHIPWEKCLASGKESVHVKYNSREKVFEIQRLTIK